MIRESALDNHTKKSKQIKIIMETPSGGKKKNFYSKTANSESKHGRNFKGLYIQSTEKDNFREEMDILYQGGTPVNFDQPNENYKPLPLSIAKLNFHSDIKPAKYNTDYFKPQYSTINSFLDFEKNSK